MSVDAATTELTEELGQLPTAAEIADRLDVSVEDGAQAIEVELMPADAVAGRAAANRRRGSPVPRSRRCPTPSRASTASRPTSPPRPAAIRHPRMGGAAGASPTS